MFRQRHTGFLHQTVNHTIGFVDERTGDDTNTIDRIWRHIKAFLNPYNRVDDYIYHLVHYMFAAECRSENEDQFAKFIGIVASMDWRVSISPDTGTVVNWLTVAPPMPYSRGPEQVKRHKIT